jgi:hypothetical protein
MEHVLQHALGRKVRGGGYEVEHGVKRAAGILGWASHVRVDHFVGDGTDGVDKAVAAEG